jgi:hypothetical protein
MKLLFRTLAILLVISITTASCDDDDNDSNIMTFKATLIGASERPNPVTTSATGTAALIFNNTTKMFTVTGNYTGMTPISGHIHGPTTTEQNAGVLFTLNITTTNSGTISYTSTAPLTTAQEAELKNGLYYINVHSNAYPGGEIRGQLFMQ